MLESLTLIDAIYCYITAHEVGLVTLQVACEGFVISNSVIFEYKKPPSDENKVKEVKYLWFLHPVFLVIGYYWLYSKVAFRGFATHEVTYENMWQFSNNSELDWS